MIHFCQKRLKLFTFLYISEYTCLTLLFGSFFFSPWKIVCGLKLLGAESRKIARKKNHKNKKDI